MRASAAIRIGLLALLLVGACRGRSILEPRASTPADGGLDGPTPDAEADGSPDVPIVPDGGGDGGASLCSTSCASPPPAVCLDATHARHFNLPGTCQNAQCAYVVTDVVCARGCEAGFCREDPCLGVTCDVPPSACQGAGVCDRGQCRWPAAPAGVSCEDDDPCTTTGTCDGKGNCIGQPLACTTPPALSCVSATSAVVHDPVGACGETGCAYISRTVECAGGCQNGTCLGDPCAGVACSQPPGPCYANAGTCVAGQCQYPALADGTACSDGDACTTGDSCQAGACRGGAAAVCSDGDGCTADRCEPATGCVYPAQPDGFPCDDGNRCSATDVCRDHTCHGETLACDDSNGCTVDTCDVQTGGCQHRAIPDGTACTDGSICTSGDVCTGGVCLGQAVNCDDKKPCTVDRCDPDQGCQSVAAVDGTACTDENPCTKNDHCQAGVCTGTGLSCDDGNSCTKDQCNPQMQMCEHMLLGQGIACDDKNACTTGDRCGPTGACGGTVASCDDGNPCTAEACDPVSGCAHVRIADGTSCDDQDPCTSVSRCLAGVCLAVTGVSCDDLDPCTVDSCDLGGTCTHTPVPDGGLCGGPAGCRTGRCTAGRCIDIMTSSCDDANPCTADSCGADGRCAYTAVADGTGCSDGNACTSGDRCLLGVCAGTANTCDDGNPCTGDVCGVDGSCTHTMIPTGSSCDDGNPCTVGELCTGTVCGGGQARDCNDGNGCTADLCDTGTGCVHLSAPDGTGCNDGNLCTQADQCRNGACAGTTISCTTNDKCLSGSCDPSKGCVFQPAPDGSACNDGDKCTTDDACQAGKCTGSPKTCDDGNPCTTDSCAPLNGACVSLPAPAGTACNDNNPCTSGDQCVASTCLGTPVTDHTACQTATITGCCVTGLCCNVPGCCL